MVSRAKRHTQGRQKIEIKKIQNEEALRVSFSKRRVGLFKKVSELSTLCGAEFAVVAFSPTGRPYSFGQPSVDSIVNRFFNEGSKLAIESPASTQIVARTNSDLNNKLADLKVVLEKLRQKKQMLEEELKRSEIHIKSDVDALRMEELQEYERRLVELRGNVEKYLGRIMMMHNEFGVLGGSVDNSGSVMQKVAPLNNEVGVSERGGGGGYFQYGNHLGGGGGASGAMCYRNNAFFGAFQ